MSPVEGIAEVIGKLSKIKLAVFIQKNIVCSSSAPSMCYSGWLCALLETRLDLSGLSSTLGRTHQLHPASVAVIRPCCKTVFCSCYSCNNFPFPFSPMHFREYFLLPPPSCLLGNKTFFFTGPKKLQWLKFLLIFKKCRRDEKVRQRERKIVTAVILL